MPKITLYRCMFDTAPNAVAEWSTWAELAHILGAPKPFLHKEGDVPMFSAAELVPGAVLRKGQPQTDFRGVHFAVFDFDKHPQEQGLDGKKRPLRDDEIAALVADLNVDYILASSWSHQGGGTFRGRLIMPLSRIVLPSEWARLWPVLNRLYAKGLGDTACKDYTRRYWVPSFPEGGHAQPVFVFDDSKGAAIDVDQCLLQALPVTAPEGALGGIGPLGTPTSEQLYTLSRTWANSKKVSQQRLGAVLKNLVRGEPYAYEEGQRDNLMFQLCGDLVTRWPNLDADVMARMFVPSLVLMEAISPGAPTYEKCVNILQRRQQRGLQERSELIRSAIGRPDPYTAEELDEFCAAQGLSLDELKSHWILQKDRNFYVMVGGTYRGPYTDRELKNAARRDLSPAVHLELDFVTDRGLRAKNNEELIRDYGTVIDGLEADMNMQATVYDRTRRVLVEAPCPLQVVEPVHSPQIDQWLRLLGGPRYDVLEKWLACVTMLSEPLAALYLAGVKDAGKSLLGEGVARLWGPRATQIQEVVGTAFNEQAARNPLILVDEMGPLQSGSGFRTQHLRWLIQTRSRPLHRKFQAPATLRGASRIIFATNDGNGGASTDENLTAHDISAIAERIIYIPAGDGAPDYLKTQKALDPDIYDRWVSGLEIARHVLWLRDNVEVKRQGRFMVSGDSEDLLLTLAISAGVRSEVCQWLIGFLQNPNPIRVHTGMRNLVLVKEGSLLVNAKAIYEAWSHYVPNDKNPPKTAQISKALAGLSKPERRLVRHAGRAVAYREIDLRFLVAWGDLTGYATEEDLIGRMVENELAIAT